MPYSFTSLKMALELQFSHPFEGHAMTPFPAENSIQLGIRGDFSISKKHFSILTTNQDINPVRERACRLSQTCLPTVCPIVPSCSTFCPSCTSALVSPYLALPFLLRLSSGQGPIFWSLSAALCALMVRLNKERLFHCDSEEERPVALFKTGPTCNI